MLKEIVYQKLRQVPKGKVTTYKKLAEACGVKAYRAIGQILKNNPYAPEVPCHRVVKSDGQIGGFMGKIVGSEINKKIKMLSDEGVGVVGNRIVDFKEKLHTF